MLLVSEIFDDAKRIFGICDEKILFRFITDSIEMLANKGEVDPLVGYLDICVDNNMISLPREVETVLGVNLGGRPALGHDALFSFHLNGPGDFKTRCDWTWDDKGTWPTQKDLKCPSKLVAFVELEEDEGKELRVFGFDKNNKPLRTKVGDEWQNGLIVPTIFGYALPDSEAPEVGRITGIVKDVTAGVIRLSSFDNDASSGVLIGVYEWDETKPQYRRIRISRGCPWVRMVYRKRTLDIRSTKDRILLHSRLALVYAMHAVKFARDFDLANSTAYEAHATRLLTERESSLQGPMTSPVQIEDRNSIMVKDDWNVE